MSKNVEKHTSVRIPTNSHIQEWPHPSQRYLPHQKCPSDTPLSRHKIHHNARFSFRDHRDGLLHIVGRHACNTKSITATKSGVGVEKTIALTIHHLTLNFRIEGRIVERMRWICQCKVREYWLSLSTLEYYLFQWHAPFDDGDLDIICLMGRCAMLKIFDVRVCTGAIGLEASLAVVICWLWSLNGDGDGWCTSWMLATFLDSLLCFIAIFNGCPVILMAGSSWLPWWWWNEFIATHPNIMSIIQR